jgi:hypothetical protein
LFLKKLGGKGFSGSGSNRMGIQTAGIDVFRLDQIAFGIGVVSPLLRWRTLGA